VSSNIFRVVYCSHSVTANPAGGMAALLDQILSVARENNARSGITGALLCNDGLFAQVLEGDLMAVQDIFERIQRDTRHNDVLVLEAGMAGERLFDRWDMALAEAADPARAAATLTRALAHPDGIGGSEVVALLDGLVHPD